MEIRTVKYVNLSDFEMNEEVLNLLGDDFTTGDTSYSLVSKSDLWSALNDIKDGSWLNKEVEKAHFILHDIAADIFINVAG